MNEKQPLNLDDRKASIRMQILTQNIAQAIDNLAMAFEREDAYKVTIAELGARVKDLEDKLNPRRTDASTDAPTEGRNSP